MLSTTFDPNAAHDEKTANEARGKVWVSSRQAKLGLISLLVLKLLRT